jgi:hypothetical protein
LIEQSPSIAKLAAALVQVQGTVEGAVKGKANPAFKGTKYADLAAVWDACREQLVANGLTVVQFPGEMVENRMTMTTQLSHESGEWMRGTLSIPLSKVDAQGYGSAVTYARRYALAAVVGVCPEDDDGNAASRPAPRQEYTPPADPVLSQDQRREIMMLAEKAHVDAKTLCAKCKIDAVANLPATRFDDVRKWLLSKMPSGPQHSDILEDEVPF